MQDRAVPEADPVPEADRLEQGEPAEGGSVEEHIRSIGGSDRPEADVLEQDELVEEDQFVARPLVRGEAAESSDEADWLDQSLGVSRDEERRGD